MKRSILLNGDKPRRVPKAVHQQCVWIMRDRDRLMKLVSEAEALQSEFSKISNDHVFYADEKEGLIPEAVVLEAKCKLEAIDTALEDVPPEYREGILDNLSGRPGYPDEACENTWRKWKSVFIAKLAHELLLF